jgi:phage recombination protein Bet
MDIDKSVIVFNQNGVTITEAQRETFVNFISAQNPTEEELNLHFYFCALRGVHPLDRLIYFTKRSGKYTPITSIDYMRMRAEVTGAYAGNDDSVFKGAVKKGEKEYPGAATVTVYKMVNGQRCPFTGTARWSEYAPPNLNEPGAFMWKNKPFVMLAKCAEAIALRKGFPGNLNGLYTAEEYEQIPSEPVTHAPNKSHAESAEEPPVSEDVIEGEVSPAEEVKEVRVVRWFDGKDKPADELVSVKVVAQFSEKFVGKGLPFENIKQVSNELKRVFNVDKLSQMTWEKMYAFIAHVRDGDNSSKWYAPAEKAAPVDISEVDVAHLVGEWRKTDDNAFDNLPEVERKQRVEGVLELVKSSAIAPGDYDAMVGILVS